MLNKAILMGRLTRDPELRHTQSNMAVCSFSLGDRSRSQGSERRTPDRLHRLRRMGPSGRVRCTVVHQGFHGDRSRPVSSPAAGRIRTATTAPRLKSTAMRFPSVRPRSPATPTTQAVRAGFTGCYDNGLQMRPEPAASPDCSGVRSPAGDSGFQELADDDGDVPF